MNNSVINLLKWIFLIIGFAMLGLGIMSERAQRLGGELTVGARPAGGTRVRLAFPAAGARCR